MQNAVVVIPSRLTASALALAAALVAAGCFRAQAKAFPEAPPLEMPSPPPRVVEVTDPEVPPPVPLPEEPARTPPFRPRPAPPTQRTESPRPSEPVRAEIPAPESPKPVEEPKATPPATLQTTPAQREAEVERGIRTILSQAGNDLNRINYQALNVDAKNQYDQAKGFVRQAEEALRVKNLKFAQTLADKAATLASQLGR